MRYSEREIVARLISGQPRGEGVLPTGDKYDHERCQEDTLQHQGKEIRFFRGRGTDPPRRRPRDDEPRRPLMVAEKPPILCYNRRASHRKCSPKPDTIAII